MSEIIKTIKNLAHKVSEDYLLFGKDMNESLIELSQEDEIANLEILKRVCEQSNLNVYLSLFNNSDTDKSNIKFDLADSSKVYKISKESEDAMKDYGTPPEDFRSSLELAIMPTVEKELSESEKLSELNVAVHHREVFRNLLNKVGMMKTAEAQSANNSINAMAHDAKILIANGESIGDISKIATRFVKEELEGDFVKVAECYDIIHKDLINGNFKVKTGFSKFSSQRINNRSDLIGPVRDFATSIAKIAGLTEMEENLEKTLSVFDGAIKEEAK